MSTLKDAELKAILNGETIPDKKKLPDGEGLYIHLKPLKSGGLGMYWRFDYQYAGKRKTLPLGTYPLITVSEARKTHREAKVGLTKGIDPMAVKRAGKIEESSKTSFSTVARLWLEHKEGAERGKKSIANYFKNDIFPIMGSKGVNEVLTSDVVKAVQRVSNRGSQEQAHRVGRWIYKIFRYARTTGLMDGNSNPADIDLSIILKPHRSKPHAAITDPELFGQFLRDVDHYHGYYATTCLLKMAALVMLRPGELVAAEWSEINFETSTWTIEARRMKNRQRVKDDNWEQDQHIIPLSRQVVAILRELQQYNSVSKYVFPGLKGNAHMCRDTIRYAIRNMGYDSDTMTGHGFRASARTMLEDQLGYDAKTAERQLAHKGKDPHRGAYDRTKHMDKRRVMLQEWADYLDVLRDGVEGITFKAKAE